MGIVFQFSQVLQQTPPQITYELLKKSLQRIHCLFFSLDGITRQLLHQMSC